MDNIRYISAKDACDKASKGLALLLDVREEMETSDVWIDMQNVIAIPFSNIAESKKELPKDKSIVVFCAIGIVSKMVATFLMENKGFTDVYVMENGLIAWATEELPLKYGNQIPFECNCCNINKDEC